MLVFVVSSYYVYCTYCNNNNIPDFFELANFIFTDVS
jgi:hypothetical protein